MDYDVKRAFIITLILFNILLIIPIHTYTFSENNNVRIIAYVSPLCLTCKAFESIINSIGVPLEKRSIAESRFLNEYEAIVNTLELNRKLTPLAIFLKNCSVVAIAYGIGDKSSDRDLIDKIIRGELTYVIVLPDGMKKLDENIARAIEKIIECGAEHFKTLPLPSLIALVTSLALSDSINPCTLYLYLLLLISASLITLSKKPIKKHVLAVGLAFIVAVMIGYIMLGLGLLSIISFIPKYVFIAIGIGFGLWTIVSALKGKGRIISKEKIFGLIPRVSENVFMSCLLGLLATFTLLPCSAGSYIVFIGIVSRLPKLSAIGLLLYYNVLFVMPLIALLLAFLIGVSHEYIRDFILKNHVKVSILAGSLLIAIAIYMFFLPI